MAEQFWRGVKRDSPEPEIFPASEADVTPERYPQFKYVFGPFETEERARNFVDRTGFFTDPFCNNGGGR